MPDLDLAAPGTFFASARNAKDYRFYLFPCTSPVTVEDLQKSPDGPAEDLVLRTGWLPDGGGQVEYSLTGEDLRAIERRFGREMSPVARLLVLARPAGDDPVTGIEHEALLVKLGPPSVFVTDIEAGNVCGFNAQGHTVVVAGGLGRVSGICSDAQGRLFVGRFAADALARLDPKTGQWTDIDRNYGSINQIAHDAATNDLYVVAHSGNSVERVNPDTGARARVVGGFPAAPLGAAVAGDSLFVTYGTRIAHVDKKTGRWVELVSLPANLGCIAYVDGEIFAPAYYGSAVYRVSVRERRLVATFAAPSTVASVAPAEGKDAGKLWVTTYSGQLALLDPASGQFEPVGSACRNTWGITAGPARGGNEAPPAKELPALVLETVVQPGPEPLVGWCAEGWQSANGGGMIFVTSRTAAEGVLQDERLRGYGANEVRTFGHGGQPASQSSTTIGGPGLGFPPDAPYNENDPRAYYTYRAWIDDVLVPYPIATSYGTNATRLSLTPEAQAAGWRSFPDPGKNWGSMVLRPPVALAQPRWQEATVRVKSAAPEIAAQYAAGATLASGKSTNAWSTAKGAQFPSGPSGRDIYAGGKFDFSPHTALIVPEAGAAPNAGQAAGQAEASPAPSIKVTWA